MIGTHPSSGRCAIPVCQATSAKGTACKAQARIGGQFCFFHDDSSRKERLKAQRKGGSKRTAARGSISSPREFDLGDPQDIVSLLGVTASCVLRMEIDSKIAHAVTYLADCGLRSLQRLERIAALAGVDRKPARLELVGVYGSAEEARKAQ